MKDGEMVDIAGEGGVMEGNVDKEEDSGGPSDVSSEVVGAKPLESSWEVQKKNEKFRVMWA